MPYNLAEIEPHLVGVKQRQAITPRRSSSTTSTGDTAELVRRLLPMLSSRRCSEYADWLNVGFVCHHAGLPVDVWIDWSQGCPEKFDELACHEKWSTFNTDTAKAITAGSMIQWAAEDTGRSVADILQEINPSTSTRPNLTAQDCEFADAEADQQDQENSFANQAGSLTLPAVALSKSGVVSTVSAPLYLKQHKHIPFPMEALPEPIRCFVAAGSEALGCDPSYVGLPVLIALASAIGNTRRIELKRGWVEPAVLWGAIVGESGTLKSPAMELALRPLRKRQHEALRRYAEALKQYETDMMQHEVVLRAWKQAKTPGNPPTPPEEPVADRCLCDDVTIEALAVLLQRNPRGLLVARDELSGWLGSFDRYAQGKGDAPKWLEMFGARALMVDRKTGVTKTTYVPRAAVSVIGGIQPRTLHTALGTEHKENGLAARLLLAFPPRATKRWTESTVAARTLDQVEQVFGRLFCLECVSLDGQEPQPLDLPLQPAAKEAWIEFYNQHATEQTELAGDLAYAWSKLEGYAARLALVVHLVRWAAGDPALQDAHTIDDQSVASGVRLSRWFGTEAERVYGILAEDDDQRQHRQLLDLIESQGGVSRARDIQRASRKYATADAAEQALDTLVRAGLGTWDHPKPGSAGGHPVRVFRLTGALTVDTTQRQAVENEGSVNNDSDI